MIKKIKSKQNGKFKLKINVCYKKSYNCFDWVYLRFLAFEKYLSWQIDNPAWIEALNKEL